MTFQFWVLRTSHQVWTLWQWLHLWCWGLQCCHLGDGQSHRSNRWFLKGPNVFECLKKGRSRLSGVRNRNFVSSIFTVLRHELSACLWFGQIFRLKVVKFSHAILSFTFFVFWLKKVQKDLMIFHTQPTLVNSHNLHPNLRFFV